jgi:TRAP-type C4-dicarboxylate transport system permease small subunit
MEGQTKTVVIGSGSSGGFTRFIQGYSRVVDPLAKWGGAVGSAALAVMMFLTVFDVSGRFLGGITPIHNAIPFFGPIIGTTEITEFLMSILVVFGLGYMAFHKGHIRVDLILQYTSKRVNRIIDVYTYFFSTVLYAAITWQCWFNVTSQRESGLTSASLLIPIYPFIFITMIGAGVVTLVLLRDFLKSVEEVGK